jgi:hypothetical protein
LDRIRQQRCAVVMRRTSRRRSASTIPYPDVAEVRRLHPILSPQSDWPEPTASMIASERKGSESPKVQLWNLPALEGKRFQSEVKGRRETPLVHHVVTTVARPGDVELRRMPRHRTGEAELMIPPWYRPGGDELMLPPWYWPGGDELMLPPWYWPGGDELMLPPWYWPGGDELMLPPWQGPVMLPPKHRPGKVEQELPPWPGPVMLSIDWPA